MRACRTGSSIRSLRGNCSPHTLVAAEMGFPTPYGFFAAAEFQLASAIAIKIEGCIVGKTGGVQRWTALGSGTLQLDFLGLLSEPASLVLRYPFYCLQFGTRCESADCS